MAASEKIPSSHNLKRPIAFLLLTILAVFWTWCSIKFYRQESRNSYVLAPKPFRPSSGSVEDNDPNLIVYTVRTSKQFLADRLDVLLKTWIGKLTARIFFISDGDNSEYQEKTGHRLVPTSCGTAHSIRDLCCKLENEYLTMKKQENARWWCHFDDDVYVNVPVLEKELRKYDWTKPWYIGKRSVPEFKLLDGGKYHTYQFAHGGCGFCLSTGLLDKMTNWIGDGKFLKTCNTYGLYDDVTMGIIVTYFLKVPLTESFLFHSHFERLEKVPEETIHEQISLSYRDDGNYIKLSKEKARFSVDEDPTRLLSLHCLVYPKDEMCL